MKKTLLFAALSGLIAPIAANAELSDAARQVAEARACQAAIWAMPAVSTWDIRLSITRDLGGKVGDVVALSEPMSSRHGFLTANDVVPYSIAALSTADGPLVVEVPPASEKTVFFGTFVDAWMRPVADVGPTGSDEGKGAKYLFVPPGYDGEIPQGYLVFPLETYGINYAFRPISQGDGTVADAAAYSRTVKVYPLAQADNPPETTFIDAAPLEWDTLPYYDITYFQDLNGVIQSEPIRERDKSMLGLLAEIGIEKGKPFEPNAEWVSIYEAGAQCAFDFLQEKFVTPGGSLKPFYDGDSQWQAFNASAEQAAIGFPFENDGVPLIDLRAQSYFYLTYYPVKLGPGSFYITALRDGDGAFLNATDTYRLNIPQDAPARDFWSAIAYSMKTKGFIKGGERVGLSRRQIEDMNVNDDGSVDLYFAPNAPEGQQSNWIPTGEDFFVMFRLYGPEKAAFDKSWQLGNIERVK